MITNISLVTIYCLDQDAARDYYVAVLGFEPHTDVTMGEGFRWVTVGHPSQPELEITLMTPLAPRLIIASVNASSPHSIVISQREIRSVTCSVVLEASFSAAIVGNSFRSRTTVSFAR